MTTHNATAIPYSFGGGEVVCATCGHRRRYVSYRDALAAARVHRKIEETT